MEEWNASLGLGFRWCLRVLSGFGACSVDLEYGDRIRKACAGSFYLTAPNRFERTQAFQFIMVNTLYALVDGFLLGLALSFLYNLFIRNGQRGVVSSGPGRLVLPILEEKLRPPRCVQVIPCLRVSFLKARRTR